MLSLFANLSLLSPSKLFSQNISPFSFLFQIIVVYLQSKNHLDVYGHAEFLYVLIEIDWENKVRCITLKIADAYGLKEI